MRAKFKFSKENQFISLDPSEGLEGLIVEVEHDNYLTHEFHRAIDYVLYRGKKLRDYLSSELEFTREDVIDVETGISIFDHDGLIVFK